MNKDWQIKEGKRINKKFGNEGFQPVPINKIENKAKEVKNGQKNQYEEF